MKAGLSDSLRGCGSYGSDLVRVEMDALRGGTIADRFDGVGAGKDEPVEVVFGVTEVCDCGVQCGKRCWRYDFNGRNEDGLGTKAFELRGEDRSLLRGSG